MATSLVALDPSQYVRVNTGKNPLILQSLRDDVRIAFVDSQPSPNNSVFHPLGGDDAPLQLPTIDTNVWVKATTNKCGLVVTENLQDQISKASIADTNNSARTPDISVPTDSSPYVGAWSFNDGFNGVVVTMDADVSGRLYFDFYDVYDVPTSGSTANSTFPVAGFEYDGLGFNEFHQAVKGGRWFRIRFVPDDASGTEFRVNTYFLKQVDQANIPANQAMARDQDCVATRTTITQDEISRGLRTGVSQFNKFAFREISTGGATYRTVWNNTATFTPLKTASTFTIAYNNTTDGASTTGALALLVSYLDSNEKLAQATVVLGSTGSDVTAFSGLGINRIVVVSSGTADTNTNDITLTATTGGSTQAIVPAGTGVTQQAIFFAPDDAVPLSKFLWINAVKTSGGQYPLINFRGWVYNRTVDSKFLIFSGRIDTQIQSTINIVEPCNFPLSRRDVLWFEMQSSTNGAAADLRFSTNLYNDD